MNTNSLNGIPCFSKENIELNFSNDKTYKAKCNSSVKIIDFDNPPTHNRSIQEPFQKNDRKYLTKIHYDKLGDCSVILQMIKITCSCAMKR